VGDPVLVWRAAGQLGVEAGAAEPAAAAGLVEPDGQVRFRYPLVRSAIYQAAAPGERQSVHQAARSAVAVSCAFPRAGLRSLGTPGAS
jgi:hypothetical protein